MFRRLWRPLVRSAALISALVLLAQAPAAQTPLPDARRVIDRYLEVSGGAAGFKALQSMRATGTMAVPAQQMSGDLEVLAARPNRRITRINIAGIGASEEGFDGKVAWSIDPLNGPALVTGRELAERTDDAWFDGALHASDFVKEMSVTGREEFDGRPVYRLRMVTIAGLEQFEFFDVQTGVQIGYEARRETPMGSVPVTATYRDHRKFGRITMPGTIVQRVLGVDQVVTFTSIEFDKVPATAFELPVVIKALIK